MKFVLLSSTLGFIEAQKPFNWELLLLLTSDVICYDQISYLMLFSEDCLILINQVVAEVQRKTLKLNTADRIVGMLSVIKEELADVPFFYVIDQMCKILHCTPPTLLQLRYVRINFHVFSQK